MRWTLVKETGRLGGLRLEVAVKSMSAVANWSGFK